MNSSAEIDQQFGLESSLDCHAFFKSVSVRLPLALESWNYAIEPKGRREIKKVATASYPLRGKGQRIVDSDGSYFNVL